VVLTNGTFLNGQIHIGDKTLVVEERASASHGITEDLINAGFEAGRMKTGTLQEWMDVLWIIRK
jgi:tRNA uridine 5-carboxymethylaminomethyl modification enzyme